MSTFENAASEVVLGHADKSEEERREIDAWEPVVRVLGDQRMRVALVGGVNVGKSQLWNSLVNKDFGLYGRLPQLSRDVEALTRDAVESIATVSDMHFTLADTPGVIDGALVEEARRHVATADLVLFVVSMTSTSISPDEEALAADLRRRNVPVVLLLNKADAVTNEDWDAVAQKYMGLGLGSGIPISALAGTIGYAALETVLRPVHNAVVARLTRSDWDVEDMAAQGSEAAYEEVRSRNNVDQFLRVAIVGRPNSGKSSLVNRLVGHDRARVSDDFETTRDALEIACEYRGTRMKIIDTAGIDRLASCRKDEFLFDMYNLSKKAIAYAHIVVICFDATEGHPDAQDMKLCHEALREGRGVVMCACKWDKVLDHMATAEAIDYQIKRQISEARFVNAVVTSAVAGTNLHLLLDQILEVYTSWNKTIRTGDANRFWRRFEKTVNIPHHVSRIGYMKQSHARPPTFVLHLQTRSEEARLSNAQQAMVRNALAEEFEFNGVPIRLIQEVKNRLTL